MVAVLENALNDWLAQMAGVPSAHPIECILIGIVWMACMSVRSIFAAVISTLLSFLAVMLLAPAQSDIVRWVMLGVLFVANVTVVLHIVRWRKAARRQLDGVSAELAHVRRAYEAEVHWRMAAYKLEASQIAATEVPMGDLTERVETLARQLNATRPAKKKSAPEEKLDAAYAASWGAASPARIPWSPVRGFASELK
jgi:hypothetical protein